MSASIDSLTGYSFRPGISQSLATLVLLPLLFSLGVWQLHRAQEKETLFATMAAAQHATAQPVSTLHASPLPQHGYAAGRYDQHIFLLDNRVHDGHVGYELLAPLQLGDGSAVLIDGGWLPQGEDRAHLPRISLPGGQRRVVGLALRPAPPPFALTKDENLANGWPKVIQGVVPEQLSAALGYPLLPVVLYPDGSAAAREEIAALQYFTPLRHRAYALQWFVMAVVLLFLYLRHGLHRERSA